VGKTVFTLDPILGLVGSLNDALGSDTPGERVFQFLRDSDGAVEAVRD